MYSDLIRADELLERLGLLKYHILQKKEGYRFSMDPILLAGFASVKEKDRLLDLGTGGGILPFLLQKKHEDKDLSFTGVDIQADYIDMAQRSAKINELTNLEFFVEDIKNLPEKYKASFDLVICNPPFYALDEGKISKKKDLALARHEVAVDLPAIIKAGSFALKDKGAFIFIHRCHRLFEAQAYLEKEGLSINRLRFIYGKEDIPAKLFMAQAVKRKNPQLEIMAPLIVYDREGNYREEVKSYYE